MNTLRNVWAVWLREMGAYFLSPLAWIIIFLFVLQNGAVFWVLTSQSSGHPRQVPLVASFLLGYASYWVIPLSPLLTMRLLAEERRLGTFEVLMTAPVTEVQVVVGKFLAAQAFYCLIWLSLAPLVAILHHLAIGTPDWGPVLATYVGLFGLGFLTNSLGMLASASVRNQLGAAVLALSGNLFLCYLVPQLARLFPPEPGIRRFFDFISFFDHFGNDYGAGIVDVRYLLTYLVFAAFFLLLSIRIVESKRP